MDTACKQSGSWNLFACSVCRIVMNIEEVCLKKEPCLQTNCEGWRPKSRKWFVTNNLVSSVSLCLTLAQMGVAPFQSKQSSPAHSLVTRLEECSTFLWVFTLTSKYACFICVHTSLVFMSCEHSNRQDLLLWMIPTESKIKLPYLQME